MRRWHTIVMAALAIILLGVQAADFHGTQVRMARQAVTLRQHAAEESLAQVNGWIRERRVGVRALSGLLALMSENRIQQGLDSLRSLAGDTENTYVGFVDGTWAIPGQWKAPDGYDPRNRLWFSLAVGREAPVVTEPYRDIRRNERVVAFAQSFRTVDGKQGVVAQVVPVSRLRNLLRTDQDDYSAVVQSGQRLIVGFAKGDVTGAPTAFTATMTNGWTVNYRLSTRPSPRAMRAVLLRKTSEWLAEMLSLLALWAVASGYVRSRTQAASKNLQGLRELTTLDDLPEAIVSLSRDVAALPEVLLQLLALKDGYTARHSRNVAELAVWVGRRLGLPKETLSALRFAGILHDIGKVGIPEQVLHKPGALDDQEWLLMLEHPMIGSQIADRAGLKQEIVEAIRDHHERPDGSGYPAGRRRSDLGLLAQIIGVADVYDAMISDRPYRRALAPEVALQCLGDELKFDQRIVGALKAVIVPPEAETAAENLPLAERMLTC